MEGKTEKGDVLEYVENSIQHPYTEDEKRKVVRKLDLHLLPFCFLLYTFSVLDVSFPSMKQRPITKIPSAIKFRKCKDYRPRKGYRHFR